jgi:membrane protein DedA with SNARE-associated domain
MLSDAPWILDALASLPDAAMTPFAVALILATLTLLLEDAAIAAGILLVGDGVIGLPLALAAVAGGIAGGDLLLYATGLAARRLPALSRRIATTRAGGHVRRLLDGHLVSAVFIARVVPGLRLAVYTAAGFLALPFAPFALLVSLAVALWTGLLFAIGTTASMALAQVAGLPLWQAVLAFFVLLSAMPLLARRLAASRRHRR